MDLARHRCGSGGVIDEDRAFLHAGEHAVIAVDDRAHVVVVADAHHDEVAVLRRLARRQRMLAAVLFCPLLRFRRGAVVDGDVVAAFLEQMPGHGITHDAEAERNFRHLSVS